MVEAIIIMYLRKKRKFHLIKNSEIKLSKDGNIISKMDNNYCYDNSSFGIMEISSNSNLTYSWHLRIIKDQYTTTSIGITSNRNVHIGSAHATSCYTYAWGSGIDFRQGDKVIINVLLPSIIL